MPGNQLGNLKNNYSETNNEVSSDVFENDMSDTDSVNNNQVSTPPKDDDHINKS